MSEVSELVEKYLIQTNQKKVSDPNDLQIWLVNHLNKYMPRKLFYAKGKGGGQTYKTLFEVLDVRGNRNKPCYFYNENHKAVAELVTEGHIPLQDWVDDTSLRLKKPKQP